MGRGRAWRFVKRNGVNGFWGCLPCSGFFLHSIQRINASYPALFDKRDDIKGSNEGESDGGIDEFSKHFGWLYNAKMVADFEAIPLQSVWDLKVLHFLNDLLYLKLKQDKDNEYLKKSTW